MSASPSLQLMAAVCGMVSVECAVLCFTSDVDRRAYETFVPEHHGLCFFVRCRKSRVKVLFYVHSRSLDVVVVQLIFMHVCVFFFVAVTGFLDKNNKYKIKGTRGVLKMHMLATHLHAKSPASLAQLYGRGNNFDPMRE